ncbi:sigma 54-interacting transcriptional regulator [Candidatus Uabimicrobium sp. HlEnr_7]|uniref:sigma 54-interacting transcriptional regulator n=1 Tax=Candidatus Uabimicrobium helgolandensis TaxID=3095367 RepID=UPI0035585AA5
MDARPSVSVILSTLKHYAEEKSQLETFQCFLEMFAKKFGCQKTAMWQFTTKNGEKYVKLFILWDQSVIEKSQQQVLLKKYTENNFAELLQQISYAEKNTLLFTADKKKIGFYSGLYFFSCEINDDYNSCALQIFFETIASSLPIYFQLAKLKSSATIYGQENEVLKSIASQEEAVSSRSQLQHSYADIHGNSQSLLQVLNYLDQVIKYSDRRDLLYIIGESGTGKSLVARSIHKYGPRSSQKFIEVNCGAIVGNLAEVEFFGIAPNSGVSGVSREGKIGLFELANNGVLFLDEVSELLLSTQSALLTVIEGKPFRRVCGKTDILCDVRIITASIRDIKQLPSSQFLPELAERLDGIRIEIPPLRERQEDMIKLICHFCDELSHPERKKNITPKVIELLLNYDWPGNIRQLYNCIRRCSFGVIPSYLEDVTDTSLNFDDLVKSYKTKIIKNKLRVLLSKNAKCSLGEVAKSFDLHRDSFSRRLHSVGQTWDKIRTECLDELNK